MLSMCGGPYLIPLTCTDLTAWSLDPEITWHHLSPRLGIGVSPEPSLWGWKCGYGNTAKMSCWCLSHCAYVGRGSCALHSVDLLAKTCLGSAKLVQESHGLGLKGPPVRQSPAVARALLLLSRVGEWGQVVCWVGSGWPRAASPAQGDRGPQAGCCPVLGGLWLGMLSCPASGTAVSPWEGWGTCSSGGS